LGIDFVQRADSIGQKVGELLACAVSGAF